MLLASVLYGVPTGIALIDVRVARPIVVSTAQAHGELVRYEGQRHRGRDPVVHVARFSGLRRADSPSSLNFERSGFLV